MHFKHKLGFIAVFIAAAAVVVGTLAVVIKTGVPAQESPWTVRQIRKIGSLDDPQYSFSRIEGITTNPSGEIFVLQHEEATIKQYDREGRYVRRIGRRGMGPGELALPTKLWWWKGELWVLDQASSRVSRFRESGELVSTHTLNELGLRFRASDIDVADDGSVVATRRLSSDELMSNRAITPLLHIRPDRIDTIAILDLSRSVIGIKSPDANRVQVSRNPLSSHDLYAVLGADQGVAVLNRNASGAELHWISFTGDTTRSIEVATSRQRVPGSVRDSILNDHARAAMASGYAPTLAAATSLVLKSFDPPEFYPAATGIMADHQANVWLRSAPGDRFVNWMVYDSTGKHLRTVRIPTTVRVLNVGLNSILGTQLGEFDELYVIQLQPTRESASR